MDDVTTRDHIQKHADAVVRGDMDTLATDCSDELRPQLPELAKALPQSVTSAEVLSLDVGDPTTLAVIGYSGDSSAFDDPLGVARPGRRPSRDGQRRAI